jgi:hypothetical protein
MTSQAHYRLGCNGLGGCDHYDVPGAFLMGLHGVRIPFPTLLTVTYHLSLTLPEKSKKDVRTASVELCRLNDRGLFREAWSYLAYLLGEDW